MVKRTRNVARRGTRRVRRPITKRRRPAPRRSQAAPIDHFVKCVYGPINAPSHGSGAPDGSIDPSVVIDHRQAITVSPDGNGNITVAIVSSPYGAIALGAGTATVTINSVDYAAAGRENWHYLAPVSTTVSGHILHPPANTAGSQYPVIPFKESLRSGGPVITAQMTGLRATKYRVLTNQAQIEFTGSSMYNGGTAVTGKIAHHLDESAPFASEQVAGLAAPYDIASTCARFVQPPPGTYGDISALPGANVFPARQSVMVVNGPQDFDYQEMRNAWLPVLPKATYGGQCQVFGGLQDVQNTIATNYHAYDPIPGLGHSTTTYYAATGLDPSASITFEVRTCVEYTLAFDSPAARFTSLPAPERPLALRTVKDIARSIPSSFPVTPGVENHGWLYNAASWYGRTMASIVGNVYSAGGTALKNFGPMGGILGSGAASLGSGIQHLAIQ